MDSIYKRLKNQSEILNPSTMPSIGTVFYDRRNIEGKILELEGNLLVKEDDKNFKCYYQDNKRHLAIIPTYEKRLENIEAEFERLNQSRANQGIEDLEIMPEEMLEKYQLVKATLKVRNEELQVLKSALDEFINTDTKIHNEEILQFGLIGVSYSGRANNGILTMIDGQNVSLIDNVLIINEPSSPYHTMRVIDYRKLVKEWSIATWKLKEANHKFSKKYKPTNTREWLNENWANEKASIIEENEWEDLFAIQYKGRSIPKVPKSVKLYPIKTNSLVTT